MQKKDQMLKELDLALKRKVQQKYHQNRASQLVSQPPQTAMSPIAHTQHTQQPLYRSKDYQARSPRPTRKDLNICKSQKDLATHTDTEKVVPEQDRRLPAKSELTSQEELNLWYQKELQKKKLQNTYLTNEIKTLQRAFQVIQGETTVFKKERDESDSLRQQNKDLLKETQFLQAKIKRLQDMRPRRPSAQLYDGDDNIREIKSILIQLNVSWLKSEGEPDETLSSYLKKMGKGVARLSEEKEKLSSKLKSFDIETVLMRQANAGYKAEVDKLRSELRNYQDQLQKMQLEVSSVTASKKMIEGIHKEVCRELQASRKEASQIQEIYKHRKPKRESGMARSLKETNTLQNMSSQVKLFNDKEMQTEHLNGEQEERKGRELQSLKHECSRLQLQIEQALIDKNQIFSQLQSKQLQLLNTEKQSKQFQLQIQALKQQVSRLTDCLKGKESQMFDLQGENSHKDQQLITKFQTINSLRMRIEQAEEKAMEAQMDKKKDKFERQLQGKEIERLTIQIKTLTDRSSAIEQHASAKQQEFKETLQATTTEISKSHQARQEALLEQLREKKKQMQMIEQQSESKVSSYQKQVSQLEENGHAQRKIIQELRHKCEQLETVHEEMRVKKEAIVKKQAESQQKLQEFIGNYQGLELKHRRMEEESRESQQYATKIEQSLKRVREENDKLSKKNDELTIDNQQVSKQLCDLRVRVSKLETDNITNTQLKEYYENRAIQLERSYEELARKLNSTTEDHKRLAQEMQAKQNQLTELKFKVTVAEGSGESACMQNEELKRQLQHLAEQNQTLVQELGGVKEIAGKREREQGEALSVQKYDIERLVRENKNLQSRIEQQNIVAESRNFKAGQLQERLVFLTEENRSLSSKNELLFEELTMKQRNKQEDQAHFQLKNQQYFLLLERLLDGWARPEQMTGRTVEQLLEMGCQRVEFMVGRADCEGVNLSPMPLYNFSTEIASQEELIPLHSDRKNQIEPQQSTEAVISGNLLVSKKEEHRRTVRLVGEVGSSVVKK